MSRIWKTGFCLQVIRKNILRDILNVFGNTVEDLNRHRRNTGFQKRFESSSLADVKNLNRHREGGYRILKALMEQGRS